MNNTGATLYGMECVIAPNYKKQVKTSKCKLLNWTYKKLFGYTNGYTLDCDMIPVPWENKIYFKSKEVFDRVKETEIMMCEVDSDEVI